MPVDAVMIHGGNTDAKKRCVLQEIIDGGGAFGIPKRTLEDSDGKES